ncbi:MAG: UDP-N-acetylmuramoyl-tripeptide--D-alanyl-D-alanine ligase, partial [Deltaproteobacteria bacterium]|nr:UDP-N-acetylmuramoyl-tripeptide--D-alanyl-D-alanine ligase [Deltaproteobacteria bacterium]
MKSPEDMRAPEGVRAPEGAGAPEGGRAAGAAPPGAGGLASLGLTVEGALAAAGIPAPAALSGPAAGGPRPLTGVSTDTRTLRAGDVFVALSGPSFDGADFAGEALARGAAAAVVPERSLARLAGLGDAALARVAAVPDALDALGALARHVRESSGVYLAAVTGSVGKTTVKEILRRIFAEGLGETLATEGNLNNRVGVPWTLFRLGKGTAAAVLELGASSFGEIGALARTCLPDLALVTRVEGVHLEGFGDLAGVARAKGELFRCLKEGAAAVVNLGDPRIRAMGEALAAGPSFRGRIFTFGPGGSGADLELAGLRPLPGGGSRLSLRGSGPWGGTPWDGAEADCPLPGAHNAWNALAALAAAAAAGVGPEAARRGLARAELPAGRGALLRAGGLLVVDSSYNSSPAAAGAELARLAGLPGPRGALLGDMLELGEAGPALHRETGRRAAAVLDYLALCGPLSRETLAGALEAGLPPGRARHFPDPLAAADWALEESGGRGTLLVKGSHATGVWKAARRLAPGGAPAGGASPGGASP